MSKQGARMGVAAALLSMACGGRSSTGEASGVGACGPAEACGGVLTGAWTVEQYCIDSRAFAGAVGSSEAPECDAAFRRAFSNFFLSPRELRITFDAGTYELSGGLALQYPFTYSPSCYEALTGGATLDENSCGRIESNYGGTGYSASCDYVGEACQCALSTVIDVASTGPYEAVDTELRFDGQAEGEPYCVEGTTATIDMPSDGIASRMKLRR